MIEHHIQRKIIKKLAFSDGLRFSELKPDDLENKLFDYHLKKVVKAGLVDKHNTVYKLSPEGKRVGLHIAEANSGFADEPQSVLFLAVRRGDTWLLYERKTQPVLGLQGFMHTRANSSMSIVRSAEQALTEKTGLEGTFKVSGSGYFRIYKSNQLESFTNFTLLFCDNAEGDLQQKDELAQYSWVHDPDFSARTMLPNMKLLVEALQHGTHFFIDERIDI